MHKNPSTPSSKNTTASRKDESRGRDSFEQGVMLENPDSHTSVTHHMTVTRTHKDKRTQWGLRHEGNNKKTPTRPQNTSITRKQRVNITFPTPSSHNESSRVTMSHNDSTRSYWMMLHIPFQVILPHQSLMASLSHITDGITQINH